LIGKVVLVGVTVENRRGEVTREEQYCGVVVSATRNNGVRVALKGKQEGTYKMLPPDTSVYERAEKGSYRMRSTGEVVEDPDYTCIWRVIQADA
jgi:hypothetical protein